MRMVLALGAGVLSAVWGGGMCDAQEDPHEILIRHAELRYVAIDSRSPLALEVPASWTFVPTSEGHWVFRVPYHEGVFGELGGLDAGLTAERARAFVTAWVSSRRIVLEEGLGEAETCLEGWRYRFVGRIGGEECEFFAWVGQKGGRWGYFIAQSPRAWFEVYRPEFVRMLCE